MIEVMIPMRDGVRLATDLHMPTGAGPWPVILERIPYGKRGTNHGDCSLANPSPLSKPQVAAHFAAAGYVHAIQDCRGRYASEGMFSKYLNEAEDGYDTLVWLAAQPWCNGQVACLGLSYGAHAQTALAALAPPALAAMFLDSGGFSNAFQSGIRQNGCFELKQLTWALKHARLAPETARDPARKAALAAVDLTQSVGPVPWQAGTSPLAAAPDYEAYVLKLWQETSFTPFWQHPSLWAQGHHARFPDVPMVHMSSWYDPYALTAIENFTGLQRTAPLRLILGPWTHGQRSCSHAGEVDFGTAAPLDGNLAPDYISLRRQFLDHHLKGTAPDPLPHKVTWFRMGGGPGTRTAEGRLAHGGQWQHADTWPPPHTTLTRLYLAPEGQLSPTPPTSAHHADWTHDPRHPVPSIGGAIASGAPLMHAGPWDQRERAGWFAHTHPGRATAARPDVLAFETAPLTEPLEVTGQFEALLHISSSAEDTDLVLRLLDIHPPSEDWPQGFALNLAHAVLRLSFRHGFDQPRPLVTHDIMPIHLKAFPTSNLFLPGHRLRLEIASSHFPHFDINTGRLPPATCDDELVLAHNRLHFSPTHASHILLPMARPATTAR